MVKIFTLTVDVKKKTIEPILAETTWSIKDLSYGTRDNIFLQDLKQLTESVWAR